MVYNSFNFKIKLEDVKFNFIVVNDYSDEEYCEVIFIEKWLFFGDDIMEEE